MGDEQLAEALLARGAEDDQRRALGALDALEQLDEKDVRRLLDVRGDERAPGPTRGGSNGFLIVQRKLDGILRVTRRHQSSTPSPGARRTTTDVQRASGTDEPNARSPPIRRADAPRDKQRHRRNDQPEQIPVKNKPRHTLALASLPGHEKALHTL
jgi:hypothetical protein